MQQGACEKKSVDLCWSDDLALTSAQHACAPSQFAAGQQGELDPPARHAKKNDL